MKLLCRGSILTKHTRNSAKGKGNRNPDSILRNMDPGIANDCKLQFLKNNYDVFIIFADDYSFF